MVLDWTDRDRFEVVRSVVGGDLCEQGLFSILLSEANRLVNESLEWMDGIE